MRVGREYLNFRDKGKRLNKVNDSELQCNGQLWIEATLKQIHRSFTSESIRLRQKNEEEIRVGGNFF